LRASPLLMVESSVRWGIPSVSAPSSTRTFPADMKPGCSLPQKHISASNSVLQTPGFIPGVFS